MKERDIVFNKFGGKCYLCGETLIKGWHIDHKEPMRRGNRLFKDEYSKIDVLENKMPACASCNINKRDMSIEDFRQFIKSFLNSLNKRFVQYQIAKRYGLIQETNKKVVFYFETLIQTNKTK